MALVLAYDHPAGYTAPQAYWRIEEYPQVFPRGGSGPVRVVLRAYFNAAASEAEAPMIAERVVEVDSAVAEAGRSSIYLAIKSMDGWTAAKNA